MSYFESRLSVNIENFDEIKRKLEICGKLGIKNLILEASNQVREISLELRNQIKDLTKINIFYRTNLKIKDLNEFRKAIKRIGNNFSSILSIESKNKEVQIHCARDSRVDVISYSEPENLKTLSSGIISLVKQNNSFIEFSLSPLFIENRAVQSRNFRNLYRSIQLAITKKVNYIISGNFHNIYDLRHPRTLISMCNSLLDVPLVEGKRAFKKNPLLLLDRIQNRQDRNVFESGVRIIKKGG